MSARVWLPGGRGMLGHAAQRVLRELGHDVVVTGRDVPLEDEERVRAFLAAEPTVTHVLSCAAYTAVDRAESEREAAERDNAIAPGVLSRAGAARDLPALHVSTDYVFSGEQTDPIGEDAACGPRSVYGETKLAGERAFLQEGGSAPRFVVRTSWLFGREGKNFVATMLRLMGEREELRVVADQHGRPTFADDLARAAAGLLGLDAGVPPPSPGVFHFANAPATTWHGFAARILEVAQARGLPVRCERVVPIPTHEFPTPAARPAYSVLDTTRIEAALGRAAPAWSVGVERVVDDATRALESP